MRYGIANRKSYRIGDFAGICPEYQAIIDHAVTQTFTLPSVEVQGSQNRVIRRLKGAGIWPKITGMIVMATDNTDMAKVNWKTPGTNDAQEGGTPTQLDFKAYIGYASNGVGTNGNITLDCGAMSRSNIGCTVYINTVENTPAGGVKWPRSGVEVNWGCQQEARSLTDNELIRLPGSDNTGVIQHTNRVVTMVNTTGNAHTVYEDGVQIISGTGAGTSAPPNVHNPVDGYNGYMPFYIGHEWLNATEASLVADIMLDYLRDMYRLQGTYKETLYDNNYRSVLARGSGLNYTIPSASQRDLQNALVKDMKTAGVWDKLDTFWWFAQNGDFNFARINWKNPSSFLLTIVGTLPFVSNKGFQRDSVTNTGHLETGFVPSTDGVNWTLNSASVGMFLFDTGPAHNATIMGCEGGGGGTTQIKRQSSGPGFVDALINSGFGSNSAPDISSNSVWAITTSRQSSNVLNAESYKSDGTTNTAVYGQSSTSVSTLELYVFRQNLNGSPNSGGDIDGSGVWLGGDISDKMHDFHVLLMNYYKTLNP